MTMRPEIDTTRAAWLKASTRLTWREIGILLARDLGRPVVFNATSVSHAVHTAQKAMG